MIHAPLDESKQTSHGGRPRDGLRQSRGVRRFQTTHLFSLCGRVDETLFEYALLRGGVERAFDERWNLQTLFEDFSNGLPLRVAAKTLTENSETIRGEFFVTIALTICPSEKISRGESSRAHALDGAAHTIHGAVGERGEPR